MGTPDVGLGQESVHEYPFCLQFEGAEGGVESGLDRQGSPNTRCHSGERAIVSFLHLESGWFEH